MENELELFFWLGTFIMISLVIMVIILVIVYQKTLKKYRNEQLNEQLKTNLIVEHKERERIAKELHDGLCSDLATLHNLVTILGVSRDKKTLIETREDLEEAVLSCYEEALRISYNLSPPQVKNNTISVLLSNYITRVSRVTSIELQFSFNTATFFLSDIQKLELYRIVQELVQNIIKHSSASFAKIELIWSEKNLIFYLSDNGVQYDFDTDLQSANVGLGLRNIKARINQLKAQFIHHSKGNENQISITINKENHD